MRAGPARVAMLVAPAVGYSAPPPRAATGTTFTRPASRAATTRRMPPPLPAASMPSKTQTRLRFWKALWRVSRAAFLASALQLDL